LVNDRVVIAAQTKLPPAACAACGADLTGARHRTGMRVCTACGVGTIDPWPSDTELDAAYSEWYRPASGRFGRAGEAVFRRTRASLARRLDAVAPPGPVLDIGAGTGALVDGLARRGRTATGLERGDEMLDEISGEWSAVVFWHSLEHLPRPGLALADAARILTNHGVVVVAVPNVGSIQARWFGDRWFGLDRPRHLTHWTPAALTLALRTRGFRVTRVSNVRGGQVLFGWLHGLVGVLPGHPDLYDAIRRPEARQHTMSNRTRAATIAAAILVSPLATVAAAVEILRRNSGTVYVEARRDE
jgi:hypothetical protein